MDKKEQIILLAELDGWVFNKIPGEFTYTSVLGDETFVTSFGDVSHLPDYFGNTDILTKLEEKVLATHSAKITFLATLWDVLEAYHEAAQHVDLSDVVICAWYSMRATNTERIEALLRTTGKWIEQ